MAAVLGLPRLAFPAATFTATLDSETVVIGDSVNLASRLEGANKEYRTMIMVSRRTYELVCGEILGRELDVIRVKGRSEPVGVYELIGPREENGGNLNAFGHISP